MKKPKSLKKPVIITAIAITVLLLSFALTIVIAANPIPKYLENYASEEELMSVLDGESFDDLTDEINAMGDETEYGSLAYYAQALYNKIYDISATNLTRIIVSPTTVNNLKYLILELAGSEFDPILLDFDLLYEEMMDTKNASSYRVNILLYLNQYYTYADESRLKDAFAVLAYDADDRVAAAGIQALYYSGSEAAMPIIDSMLYDDSIPKGKKTMNRLISSKAADLAKTKDKEETEKYIGFCQELLDNNQYVGAVLYALIDVHTMEAVEIVLNSDKADYLIKHYCISNDYSCMSEWFVNGEISVEKCNTYLEYLSYFPAKQALPDIQKVLEEHADFFAENVELRETFKLTIKDIENKGGNTRESGL